MSLIIYLFIIWRVLLFFFAYIGSLLLKFTPTFPYSDILLIPSGLPSWVWSFANFDGVHYITIAKSGYNAQYTQVFFPLYPLIIKIISIILPFINTILIGLIVSGFSFLASLIILNKLLLLDYSPKKTNWILLFFLFFPTSFFFGSFYTEGLFFLFLVSSFYAARLHKWWLSAILGTLASATKLIGIFLLPALLWDLYQEEFKNKRVYPGGRQAKVKRNNKNLENSYYVRRILDFTLYAFHSPVIYLIPLGLLSYMLYLQFKFGDMLYFWHAQPIFGAARTGNSIILLPQVIIRYLKIFFTVNYRSYSFWISLAEFLFTFLGILLLIKAHADKVRISYLIFSWFSVLTPTLTGTFSSMPRYVTIAFPIFIALGLIESRLIKTILLSISFIFLLIFTVFFTRGNWIS